MKQNLGNLNHGKRFLILALIFIFGGSVGCSIGTDKSTPLPEKSLNQLRFNTEGPLLELESKAPSAKAILTEGSGTGVNGHPQIDDNKIIPRTIVVPSEVEGRWKAVKILIRNKKNEERGGIQIVELGTSIIPDDSELKVTVGPFLPNFMMDKKTYTSVGNEELNPAARLIVEENGKIIYKGWAFKKFPSMYAFEHKIFSIKLLGAIPAVVS